MGPDNRTKTALAILPQWNPTGSSTLHVIGISGIGQDLDDDQHRHALFTYYLIYCERCAVRPTPIGMATSHSRNGGRSQPESMLGVQTCMNQEQRPFTAPAISPTDPSVALILTKQAAIQGPKPISRDAEKFLVKRERF